MIFHGPPSRFSRRAARRKRKEMVPFAKTRRAATFRATPVLFIRALAIPASVEIHRLGVEMGCRLRAGLTSMRM
jgi:hypothetical protein